MDPFGGLQQFWDLSQQPNSFSSLPDEDFLAFLEKQFPVVGGGGTPNHFDGVPEVVDPQHLSRFPPPIPNPTPPSSDSSPSPPSVNEHSPSRRQSGVFSHSSSTTAEPEEPGLKRKASSESIAGEPTHKSQHTNGSSSTAGGAANGNKKSSSSRRKSTGNPSQDESRLLKRKEQNRAAQRAFRERKEKHVKDLEDKVAALEAKNQMTETENENLRDLLSRLQNENMVLKQAAFTFTMPRDGSAAGSMNANQQHSFNFSSPSASSSRSPISPPQPHPPLNFNSLISFDPNMLNMNDESTASDGSMNMDFGFGQPHCQYKTIAANPMFMSFAEPSPYDSPPSSTNGSNSSSNYFNHFDLTTFDNWSPPSGDSTNGLDQLFGGNYLGTQNGVDFNALLKSPPSALSPVSHSSFRSPSSSSPSSSGSSPGAHGEQCPKTKEELAKLIESQGSSAFACEMPMAPFLRKAVADETGGAMIMCKGSSFPPTEKSDKNVEVLAAWRSITNNPQFKDTYSGLSKQDLDINELCSEFTSKARCDGTKVVLEPQGVHHIIETLAAKRQQQAKQ
ncbi:hypothetical protein WOLCODRAFT_14523 [Wolfiporia cocos MD-104 SS10]|uniref:BZIP domain-containing protein n=1 Tax=Wolfiporia cocos (strain MD-104) TaxID=742152 RepID=A0A2H3ITS3_WOLCO|nr:hypothetical protein WOLCODRAFT_14523 [Wolfiporia cocos MD-104 SS10]